MTEDPKALDAAKTALLNGIRLFENGCAVSISDDAISDTIRAYSASLPAQAPVAYTWKHKKENERHRGYDKKHPGFSDESGYVVTPLFASPPAPLQEGLDAERGKIWLGRLLAAYESSLVGQPATKELARELRDINRFVGSLMKVLPALAARPTGGSDV